MWGALQAWPELTLGYYHAILDGVRTKLGAHPIVVELEDAVTELVRIAKPPAASIWGVWH